MNSNMCSQLLLRQNRWNKWRIKSGTIRIKHRTWCKKGSNKHHLISLKDSSLDNHHRCQCLSQVSSHHMLLQHSTTSSSNSKNNKFSVIRFIHPCKNKKRNLRHMKMQWKCSRLRAKLKIRRELSQKLNKTNTLTIIMKTMALKVLSQCLIQWCSNNYCQTRPNCNCWCLDWPMTPMHSPSSTRISWVC